ncbi:translation initiation factor eIF3 subunit [Sistotremastrum niveocremeum HHB9708]|uniref:Eukaryotic translation initiation factor 3 subunit J n=2 Tax=Sistotremastraceae TaxID=3402574 RepID=A0A164TLL3_9AGAM|nr:translation initiation factor eIF3 subunit [Sistotremastrum niveocremeum HHB9708]KZT42136.1 translation initiation factor eIF3 subunit [Sistotremastrum suecicum HHB10207 ss-3]
MSDWDASDSEDVKPTPAAVPTLPKPIIPPKVNKWEGEDDEEEGGVASDWEESSEEEKPKTTTPALAPPKKKGTLKAKLAEKAAEKAARIAAGDTRDVELDDVLDETTRRRLEKEQEIKADLNHAADLFGVTSIAGGPTTEDINTLLSYQPRTKDDWQKLSTMIIDYIIKPHQSKPLYATFAELHARELAQPLRDVEVRKVATALTTLANEKQKEQRDKTSGKKKPKAATKPVLGAAKVNSKVDTHAYEESLDDFGNDDFM